MTQLAFRGLAVGLFRGSVAAVFAAALWYLEQPLGAPEGSELDRLLNGYGGRLKYLTHLNMILQCGYYSLALSTSLCGAERRASLLRARDWLFTSLAFPMGQFVSLLFWALCCVDPALVLPPAVAPWLPPALNHAMHTLPSLAGLAEAVLEPHVHRRGLLRVMPMYGALAAYLLWMLEVRIHGGFWVYPVFDGLSPLQRTAFILLLAIPAQVCQVAGEHLHAAVWGVDATDTGKVEEKKKQ